MGFTCYYNDDVNRKIADDLTIIRDFLLRELGENVLLVLLCGGFGRGEGGVLIESGERKAIVVNDYDLHIFTKYRVNERALRGALCFLAKKLGVAHIDVVIQPVYTLWFLRGTQYGYDLKYGSFPIYGDARLLDRVPVSRRLPFREIDKLLFTRAWCFLGPLKRSFPRCVFDRWARFLLLNQLSKAILAVEDAILIRNYDYCVSYVEKLRRVRRYCSDEVLLKMFKWATKFKLYPSLDIEVDISKFYFDVKHMFFHVMLSVLRDCYGKDFASWIDYLKWYAKRFDTLFQVFLRFLWDGSLCYAKYLKVKMAQVALAYAFNVESVDSSHLSYARAVLSRLVELPLRRELLDEWWLLRDVCLALQKFYER